MSEPETATTPGIPEVAPKPRCASCLNFNADSSNPTTGTCELPPQVFVFTGKAKSGDGGPGPDDRVVSAQAPVTVAMGCNLHTDYDGWVASIMGPEDPEDIQNNFGFTGQTTGFPATASKPNSESGWANVLNAFTCPCVILGPTSDPGRNIAHCEGRTVSFSKSCKSCGGTGKAREHTGIDPRYLGQLSNQGYMEGDEVTLPGGEAAIYEAEGEYVVPR